MGKKTKNMQIEGLRGIAICLIVLYHAFCRFQQIYFQTSIPIIEEFGSLGNSIFLAISGFFLVKSDDKESPLHWIKRKILRLWPAYAISITITFLMLQVFRLPERSVGIFEYLLNLICVNGYIGVSYVDGAHWFLSTIISVILVVGIIKQLRKEHSLVPYTIWLGVIAVLNLSGLDGASKIIGGGYAANIIAAMSLNRFIHANGKKDMLKWLSVMMISCLVAVLVLGKQYGLMVILSLVLLYFAYAEKLVVIGWFGLAKLGGMAYSIFLIHQNLTYLVEYRLSMEFGFHYWIACVGVGVSFGLGYLMYTIIETPISKSLSMK